MLAGKKNSVFTTEEIHGLTRLLSLIPSRHNSSEKDILTNGFSPGDAITDIIGQRVFGRLMDQVVPDMGELTVGMQLIAREPYGVHTDFLGKDDAGHGLAFLIPLYTRDRSGLIQNTGELDTSTVIFDQYSTSTNSAVEYVASGAPEISSIEDPVWQTLPKEDIDLARYFSIKLCAGWTIGSVIYWDRSLFHSSDDFRKKDIVEKSALVIFTHDKKST